MLCLAKHLSGFAGKMENGEMTLDSVIGSISKNAAAIDKARSLQWAIPSDVTFGGRGRIPRIECPAVSTNEDHNINRLFAAIVVGAHVNVNWLSLGTRICGHAVNRSDVLRESHRFD